MSSNYNCDKDDPNINGNKYNNINAKDNSNINNNNSKDNNVYAATNNNPYDIFLLLSIGLTF